MFLKAGVTELSNMSYTDIRLAPFEDEGTVRRPGSAAPVSDRGIGMAKGTVPGEEKSLC